MPRRFDVTFDSPASVEQIHTAFGDRDYWLARLEHFGGAKTLDALTVDPDGTVHVVVTEDLRHGALPSLLTAIYRGDLNIVTEETWSPTGDGRVDGEVSVAVIGAPGSGGATGALIPADGGSQLSLTGTVQFKVPLVGGKVETFIAREFAQGLPEIQRFTTSWIGAHG